MNCQPQASAPTRNQMFLFWASFLTLIAAGIGFSVRGAILKDWGQQFGFTQSELGTISGGGLIGFGVAIIFFSFFADLFGYSKLMIVAFLLHASSAIVTFAATPVFEAYGKDAAYKCLNIGMWLFALGNGTCEAVINPLTATLFPRNKTHWLNILHAGWPLGLILGALITLGFNEVGVPIRWEIKLGVFLIPVFLYGILMFNRPFPRSEASESGVSTGSMLVAIFTPILLFLFLLHALVGYVELGTDSWITNITERILKNERTALMVFIWTNLLMFTLRFFAGPIVHKINPVGLLFGSAILGTAGLYMLGMPFTDSMWPWIFAVTVYGLGKTFYWPTLLGVISERFPKAGALGLGISGGIGMISAGLLGVPGIGYKQDYAAVDKLKQIAPETYERYMARNDKGEPETTGFPVVTKIMPDLAPAVAGLDNSKKKSFADYSGILGKIEAAGKNPSKDGIPKTLDIPIDKYLELPPEARKPYLLTTIESDVVTLLTQKKAGKPVEEKLEKELTSRLAWWDKEGKPNFVTDKEPLNNALDYGAKKALFWTAAVPATLAAGFLLLIFYFFAIGGYKQVHIGDSH